MHCIEDLLVVLTATLRHRRSRSRLRCASEKEENMTFKVGDRVVAETESTERRPRSGTVREVVREQPPRYRIEWDDGRESVYTPAAGALHAERSSAGATG
jgi:Domain of unknown function (DUF1918)